MFVCRLFVVVQWQSTCALYKQSWVRFQRQPNNFILYYFNEYIIYIYSFHHTGSAATSKARYMANILLFRSDNNDFVQASQCTIALGAWCFIDIAIILLFHHFFLSLHLLIRCILSLSKAYFKLQGTLTNSCYVKLLLYLIVLFFGCKRSSAEIPSQSEQHYDYVIAR